MDFDDGVSGIFGSREEPADLKTADMVLDFQQLLIDLVKRGLIVFFEGQLQQDLGVVEFPVQAEEILRHPSDLLLFLENRFGLFKIGPEFGVFLSFAEFVQAGQFGIKVKDNL
jgi:hypothetical protein